MGEVRQGAIGFGLTIIPQACGCSSKPIGQCEASYGNNALF